MDAMKDFCWMSRLLKSLVADMITITLVFTASCDDNSENGPRPREPHFDFKNECQNIGPSTNQFGFVPLYMGTQYDRPMFNPHDADELLYHERGEDFNRIIKYRISTGETQVFLDPAPVVLELDWGRNGWIAFSGYGDMFLIREDGSDLHSIPIPTNEKGYSCAEPDFNPDGTVVGFPFGGIDGISLYGMYLLYNVEVNRLDTFDSYREVLNTTRPLAWSSQNKMLIGILNSARDESIGWGTADMETHKKELFFRQEDRKWTERFGDGLDVRWSTDGKSVYFTGNGIIRYPIAEHKEIRIKKACESRYYEDFTISPDDRQIVVERVDVKREGPFSNTLQEWHRLYIMDIDGCNERLLFDK